MRLLCWNTNGIAATARAASSSFPSGGLAAFFASLSLDIACLQETKLSPPKLTEALALPGPGWDSAWACSAARQGYSGVATFCASGAWAPVAPPAADALPDVDPAGYAAAARVPAVAGGGGGAARDPAGPTGPGVGAGGGAPAALPPAAADPARPRPAYAYEGRSLETDHGAFVLLNLYAPNAGDRARDGGARAALKAAFLAAARARADALLARGRGVIVVGDMNVAASPDDVAPSIAWDGLWSRAEADALAALTAPPLVDVWRATHPGVTPSTAPPRARGFTVWDERTGARTRDAGLRIDFVLVSAGLLSGGGATCEVAGLDPGWSDHDGLVLDIPGLDPPPRPPPREGARVAAQPGMESANPRWRKGPSVKALFSRAAKRAAVEAGEGSGGGGGGGGTGPPARKKAAPAAPPPPPPRPPPVKPSPVAKGGQTRIASFFKPPQQKG